MKKTSAKLLALLLVLMLSLSALAVTASAAAPAFSISSKSVAVGSTVVVEVSLSANSNAGSGNFVLKYDNAKLTPTKAVAGDLLTDAGASLTRNLSYSANSIKCAFAGAEALTDGGVLAKITFEGKEAGTAALSFESTALYTLASAPITATAGTGTVTVTGGTTVKYKLTYDANGGINPPSSQTYTSAGSRTISTTKPTWTGHVFDSWNTKANGSGDSYQPGDPIMVDKEITLYAQWTTATTNYTVTFNPNGGSVTPTSASCAAGSTVSLPTPTRSLTVTYNANGGSGAPTAQTAALTCKGWGESAGATTVVGTCGGTYKPTTATKTLYAIWDSATVTLNTTKPTKAGNTFAGWNTKADGTGTSYSTSYTGKANVTHADLA
ncbi:MAG: InlB B-repeat-containing protein, partial [Clostridia bacterium]|nr:InlB B-repeat-containing protein [Clostridia bacterium]